VDYNEPSLALRRPEGNNPGVEFKGRKRLVWITRIEAAHCLVNFERRHYRFGSGANRIGFGDGATDGAHRLRIRDKPLSASIGARKLCHIVDYDFAQLTAR